MEEPACYSTATQGMTESQEKTLSTGTHHIICEDIVYRHASLCENPLANHPDGPTKLESRRILNLIKRAPEDQPLPVPRLCSRGCFPLGATEVGQMYPAGKNITHAFGPSPSHRDYTGCDMSAVSAIELPESPVRSTFGTRPHPQFNHLSCDTVTRIEARVLQNGKTRFLEDLVKDLGPKAVREAREEVEIAAVRAVCRKEPQDRTPEDLDFLRTFLRTKEFFKDLGVPTALEPHVAKQVVVDRFEDQDIIWTKGEWAPCIYLILRGKTLLWDGDREDHCRARIPGHIIGRDDILKEDAVMSLKDNPTRLSSGRAEKQTEMLALSIESIKVIQKHHEELALKEKIRFLIQHFKPIRGLTETELRHPGSAFDKERELQELFKTEEALKNVVLLQECVPVPFEDAKYFFVFSGEVEIRKKGGYLDTITKGGTFNSEALYGLTSRKSAVVGSKKVSLISIRVKDYLMQFERRDHPLLPSKGLFDDDDVGNRIKADPHTIASHLKKPLQLQQDKTHLHAVAWKNLQEAQIPPLQAPATSCALFTKPSETGVDSSTTIGHPTDADLFPLSRRKQLIQKQSMHDAANTPGLSTEQIPELEAGVHGSRHSLALCDSRFVQRPTAVERKARDQQHSLKQQHETNGFFSSRQPPRQLGHSDFDQTCSHPPKYPARRLPLTTRTARTRTQGRASFLSTWGAMAVSPK